jgi:Kef-type K+ transport system membrane component KefB
LIGIVNPNESLDMLSFMAIFFVLLFIGLQMDIRQVKNTGKPTVILSITSLVLPFTAGYAISVLFEVEMIPGLFVGLLFSVTSVPVSAMILVELGILKSKIGTTVLSAAVVDDIISLVILTAILQFAEAGSTAIDMNALGISGLKITIFIVGIGFLAYLVHKLNAWFPKGIE